MERGLIKRVFAVLITLALVSVFVSASDIIAKAGDMYVGGNLGVGTTSPGNKLTVVKGSDSFGVDIYGLSTGSFLRLGTQSGGAPTINARNNANSADVDMALQLNGGEVGIGTASPSRNLHIGGGTASPTQTAGGIYVNPSNDNVEVTLENGAGIEGGSMAHSNGNYYIGTWSNHNVVLRQNNIDRVDITSAKVGVGGGTGNIGDTGATLGISGYGMFVRDAATPFFVGRKTSDGNLVEFYQDGTLEGAISVSTTTVTYGQFMGSHPSQMKTDEELPVGTVLIATGEIIPLRNKKAGDIEKFPIVKASSSRGQKNVYGVWFAKDTESPSKQSWGNSQKQNIKVAAVGLFVIRVTDTAGNIENGDLIQASPISGEGEKQINENGEYEPYFMDKTIAKALVDVKWDTVSIDKTLGYKWKLIPATLHAG